MSAPYAFKYIDKDNIVRDFTKIDDFVERVKNMDAKIEDLTKQISESNCSCDQERINNIDNRLQNVEELIGEDEGENDTNLNDVMSKLATHSSNINGMKLDISSNKTTLNSVQTKVTTNTTDIAELKKQIAQLNANITALMTENASLTTKLNDVYSRTRNYNMGNILVLGQKNDGTQYNAGYSLYNVARSVNSELVCEMNLDPMTQRWFDIGLYNEDQINPNCETVRKYISSNAVSTRDTVQNQIDKL